MLQYYNKTIYIPKVTKTGEIIGQIERWQAHKKSILHKAFSISLFYNNQIILQVRKHPVFDAVVDTTASSHPQMIGGEMEDEKKAVIDCLDREWDIDMSKSQLTDIGSIYYKAKDPKSTYTEHEYCTFYRADVDKIPFYNDEYAYGYSLVTLEFLKEKANKFNLAPWVTKGLKLL